MTYKEIKKYLYGDCVVRNEEYEYKTKGESVYCRQIGCITWNRIVEIPNYEKERWEIGIIAYNANLSVGVNTKVVIMNSI